MSEPSSLFAKIHIRQDQFDAFMQAPPTKPATPDANWQAWWKSRKMYSPGDLNDSIRSFDDESNAALVQGWLEAEGVFALSVAPYRQDTAGDFALVFNWFWGDDSAMALMTFNAQTARLDPKVSRNSEVPPDLLTCASDWLDQKFAEFQDAGRFEED